MRINSDGPRSVPTLLPSHPGVARITEISGLSVRTPQQRERATEQYAATNKSGRRAGPRASEAGGEPPSFDMYLQHFDGGSAGFG